MFKINNPIQLNLLDFENSEINLDDIATIVIPENHPWLNPKFWTYEIQKNLIYFFIKSSRSENSTIYTGDSNDVSDSRSILLNHHEPVRYSIQKLMQYFLLWSSLSLPIKVNPWSVQILCRSWWRLRVVKPKTLSFKIFQIIEIYFL